MRSALQREHRAGRDSKLTSTFPGELRTTRVLDREEQDLHTLEVEAVDGGVPRLTTTVLLTVEVMDQNDNAPLVVQPLQKVISVREKQPIGTTVAQIVATDADKDENATLVYDFKKGKSDIISQNTQLNCHQLSSFQTATLTISYSILIKMTGL